MLSQLILSELLLIIQMNQAANNKPPLILLPKQQVVMVAKPTKIKHGPTKTKFDKRAQLRIHQRPFNHGISHKR